MAGLGRRTHYRKHLTDSVLFDLPVPGDDEVLAKIVRTRGGNQFDIVVAVNAATATARRNCSRRRNNFRNNNSMEKDITDEITTVHTSTNLKPNDQLQSQEDEEEKKEPRPSHLAILPTKFHKLVWIKRNDYVIVQTITTGQQGNDNHTDNDDAVERKDRGGIRYIITHILYKDQIKHLQSKGLWPQHDSEFDTENDNDNVSAVASEPHADGIVYATAAPGAEFLSEEVANHHGDDVYPYDDEDPMMFVNTNRLARLEIQDSSTDDDSSDDEENDA